MILTLDFFKHGDAVEHLADALGRCKVVAMSEASSAKFEAFRRGARGAVVIQGLVNRPAPDMMPYLKRIPSPHTRRRAFQLLWKRQSDPIPGPAKIEHIEPEIPEFVEALLIHMPDESVFWIKSTGPPEPRERKQRR